MTLVPLLTIGHITQDALLNSLMFGEKHMEIKPGHTYVIKESKPEISMEHFWRQMSRGYSGLIITRQHPDHVAREFGPADLKIIWLSTTLGKNYVDPHNLGNLTGIVRGFMDENAKSVVLLDGVEYLLVNNDFSRLLKFVESLNEMVMEKKSLLLISIDQRALEEKEMALLERNARIA